MKKENIKIILTRTWSPGNIGSIMRSMKNFDFKNIVSVNQINHNDDEMFTMSAGAKDHIKHLRHSNDLRDEIGKCNIVYAFTNRSRKYFKTYTPKEMADEIASIKEDMKIGILFGNETNGLNNDEIDYADKIVTIPTSPNYSSLNLANSVLIALYEIFNSFSKEVEKKEIGELVPLKEKIELYDTVTEVVCEKLMPKTTHKNQFKTNISMLFKKMALNRKEAGFIKSLFKVIEKRVH